MKSDRRVHWYQLAAAMLGFATFILLSGGGRVLDPTYTGWLMAGDPATHWLGWAFFRETPLLQWPLGANPKYGEGLGNTIVYSDSIPLMAFALRPIQSMLPENFQYTGVWICLNFTLQAFFAFKIMHTLTQRPAASLLLCLFFVISAPFIIRNMGHFALASHWLILAGLYLYIKTSRKLIPWVALLVICALVHAYILVMLMAIYGASLVRDRLVNKTEYVKLLLSAVSTLASVILVMWAAGYFAVMGGAGGGGFGEYRTNLLSLVDPDASFSRLLANQPGGSGDYEGAAFLGSGVLIAVIISIASVKFADLRELCSKRYLPLVILSLALVVFAVSNRIAFGSVELYQYSIPNVLMPAANAFRASGRFIWPVYYLVTVWALACLCQKTAGARSILIICFALFLQVADSYAGYAAFRSVLNSRVDWASRLNDPLWDEIGRTYNTIKFVMPANLQPGWDELSHFAAINRMSVNTGYFARFDHDRATRMRNSLRENVINGDYEKKTIYVIQDEAILSYLRNDQIDGMIVNANGYTLLVPDGNHCVACAVEGRVDRNLEPKVSFGFSSGLLTFDGWSDPEASHRWSEGARSHIALPVPRGMRGSKVCIRIAGFTLGDQKITVGVDGHQLGEFGFTGSGAIQLPGIPSSRLVHIDLAFSNPHSPNSADNRILAFALQSLEMEHCA